MPRPHPRQPDPFAGHPLLRAIVETTTVAIFVKDRDGRYVLMNRHGASLWDVDEVDIVGKTDFELFPEEVASELRAHDLRVLEGGETLETEETVDFGGRKRIYFTSKVPLRDDDDRTFGVCGIGFDITHLREAEQALRESEERLRTTADALAQADRRKDEFLAMLGHELRNPMAPLRHVVELFRSRAEQLDDELRHGVGVAERQLGQMRRLVDDLLDVARLTRGQVRVEREPLPLRRPLEAAVESVRSEIERQRCRLELHLPDDDLRIEGDEARLTQALSNLLHNAAKYTPPGGVIALRAAADDEWATIEVADEGIGMSPEVLSRVFELFYQGEPTLERSEGGLGVGLTVARNLVELHGGELTAESRGEGAGSVFRLRLPRLPAARPGTVDERQGAASGADGEPNGASSPPGRRVLIVDDNRDSADSLGTLLELGGHRVEVAYDGEAGLEAAERFAPEVVLLDIGLPRLDGYEVARRLRAERDGLLIVAVTGYGQESARRKSAEAGFDHHLLKPVDLAALRELIVSR